MLVCFVWILEKVANIFQGYLVVGRTVHFHVFATQYKIKPLSAIQVFLLQTEAHFSSSCSKK